MHNKKKNFWFWFDLLHLCFLQGNECLGFIYDTTVVSLEDASILHKLSDVETELTTKPFIAHFKVRTRLYRPAEIGSKYTPGENIMYTCIRPWWNFSIRTIGPFILWNISYIVGTHPPLYEENTVKWNILSRASEVGSPTNHLGSGQRQDKGQGSSSP